MLHSVLCQKTNIKILQVNKPLRDTETLLSLAVYILFYIFTVLLVPCCSVTQDLFFFFYTNYVYTVCATFIYSYIHTSCDVLQRAQYHRNDLNWVIICLRQNNTSLLLFCRGRKNQQTPDWSAHSWGAGVTQEKKKGLASSGRGEKQREHALWCNKTPERYIKQTHNILCFVLSCWDNNSSLMLAGLLTNTWFCLSSKQRGGNTATEFC